MLRILLVDDDREFQDSVENNLKSAGHQVTTANNGRIGLDVFKNDPAAFDVIVSDIQMPEMNGLALLKAIRAINSTPVVLMTGFSELIEAHEATNWGANDFLAKPFRREELMNCLSRATGAPQVGSRSEPSVSYCKLGIDDFATGRKIKFSIFIRLADDRYVKVAHKGDDISIDRIKSYKNKGLSYLYLKQEDFRKYVGFELEMTVLGSAHDQKSAQTKFELMRKSGEILYHKIRHDGLDAYTFSTAAAFVEASMDVLTDDFKAMTLLDSLRAHADHVFVHSLGVSVYSVMISQHVKWNLPTNKFKLAVGGLLHDVGEREIGQHILAKNKAEWNEEDHKSYQSHVMLGFDMLEEIKSIPEDVRQIVKQHHENCASSGFPNQVRKTSVHPMAKLISVADEFCYRILPTPGSDGVAPIEALQEMTANNYETLDRDFLGALVQMFKQP